MPQPVLVRAKSALALVALAGLTGCMTTATGPADAAEFVPHQAEYALRAVGSTGPSADAAGGISLRVERLCDGWRVFHAMEVALVVEGGSPTRLVTEAGFDETVEGTRLDFASQSRIDEEVVELTQGRARLDPDGQGGQALFSEPEETLIDLPAGTVLPVTAFRRSLDALRAGARVKVQTLFDGRDQEGPTQVSDLFLGPAPPLDEAPKGDADLLSGDFYRVVSSYSAFDATDEEPHAVQTSDVLANGVTARWRFTLEPVELEAVLVEIEALERDSC